MNLKIKIGLVLMALSVLIIAVPQIAYRFQNIDATETRIFVETWKTSASGVLLLLFSRYVIFKGE